MKKSSNPIREEYVRILKSEGTPDKLIDHELKTAICIVKLSGGELMSISKRRIETEHCEGEDDGRGRSYAEARACCDYFETEEGFKRSNLREFDREILALVGRKPVPREFCREWVRVICDISRRPSDVHRLAHLTITQKFCEGKYDPRDHVIREANEEDLRRLRKAYAIARADFKKRLNAYWKRYGAEKLHTWTYWSEA